MVSKFKINETHTLPKIDVKKSPTLNTHAMNIIHLKAFRRHTITRVNHALELGKLDTINIIRKRTELILSARRNLAINRLQYACKTYPAFFELISLLKNTYHTSIDKACTQHKKISDMITLLEKENKFSQKILDILEDIEDVTNLSVTQAAINTVYLGSILATHFLLHASPISPDTFKEIKQNDAIKHLDCESSDFPAKLLAFREWFEKQTSLHFSKTMIKALRKISA